VTPAAAETLVVVGDALLDRDLDGHVERLAPDAPVPVVDDPEATIRPGGAGLAAALAAGDRRPVTLVTAVADDLAGRELAAALDAAGVRVIDLGLDGATPEKVRVRAAGRALLRIDRGGREPGAVGGVTPAARAALASASGVLVADYGRGVAAEAGVREAIGALPPEVPVVWDPHPRGPAPVPGVALATPNRSESASFAAEIGGKGRRSTAARARALRRRWDAAAVCVTLGEEGALLVCGDEELAVPARGTEAASACSGGGDPCGAGDRFASRVATMLADGHGVREAVAAAVACASDFVRAGGAAGARLGSSPDGTAGSRLVRPAAGGLAAAQRVFACTRECGGTTVATGGCFDLLHAGHLATLRRARALGDSLVVLLNSDDSVRRLKGPGRPLVAAADRAAVLEALDAVDAVVVFDEDTPAAAIEQLAPDVWVKGGDYVAADLPEAPLVERLGGRVEVLPYLAGHSTTRLIEEVGARGR
jgi:rfaE bifunctional protein nucleotidyltransferase chain/domain/rfaE bifunctional protein kinase chain/domain